MESMAINSNNNKFIWLLPLVRKRATELCQHMAYLENWWVGYHQTPPKRQFVDLMEDTTFQCYFYVESITKMMK